MPRRCESCGVTPEDGVHNGVSTVHAVFEYRDIRLVCYRFGTVQAIGGSERLMDLVAELLEMRSEPLPKLGARSTIGRVVCGCPLRHWSWSQESESFTSFDWTEACNRLLSRLKGGLG